MGFVTGVAASMSMAASEFLSSREDEAVKNDSKNPMKSAFYTGIAYIITVLILISPYLFFTNVYSALVIMLLLSLLIVFSYNYYISTAKGIGLRHRFFTMAAISLTVACISFFVGVIAREIFGVEL